MLKFFKVNEKGFTAVELIIALAISLLVVAAAGFILLTQSGVIRLNKSVSLEQQRLNTAFNTVRYSLRMAGFDYGQSFYVQPGSVPPVQVVDAAYSTNPYEVLVSYSAVVNESNPCRLIAVAGTPGDFNYTGSCPSFYAGQSLNIINPLPNGAIPLPTPPIAPCITQPPAAGSIQTSTSTAPSCAGNPVPFKNFGGGTVSSVNQVLFYWGNAAYTFNVPFDVPGNLYECQVNPVQVEPLPPAAPVAPTCATNTTITLSDYINNFAVTNNPPLNNIFTPSPPPYVYVNLSITGESNVALSDSPAYSVNVPYNSNAGGDLAKGNAGQIVGNNVLKTLNSSVFLRNVQYGR